MIEIISKEYLAQPNYLTYAPIWLVFKKPAQDIYPKIFILQKEAEAYIKQFGGEMVVSSIPRNSALHYLLRTTIDKESNVDQYFNILG